MFRNDQLSQIALGSNPQAMVVDAPIVFELDWARS